MFLCGVQFLASCSQAQKSTDRAPSGSQSLAKPNIVFILFDDLDQVVTEPYFDQILPFTMSLKKDGIDFRNHFITTPTCCPSRSSIMSGKYSHNTGVFSNRNENGGRTPFLDDEPDALPVQLSKSGYRTFITGKYLNGIKPTDSTTIPPGWDAGSILASPKSINNYRGYLHTLLQWDDRGRSTKTFGSKSEDYSTDVFFDRSIKFLQEAKARDDQQPFFAYIAPTCPHAPIPPAPRHIEKTKKNWPSSSFPTDRPNYMDKEHLKTKSSWLTHGFIRRLEIKMGALMFNFMDTDDAPDITPFAVGNINKIDWPNRMGSMYACDEGVQKIVTWLKDNNEWNNTLFVVTSDNGYMLGAHTLIQKTVPYEESIRVPLIINGGKNLPLVRGSKVEAWTLNIDFMPTFLDITGVQDSDPLDGQSFSEAIFDGPADFSRSSFLMEYLGSMPLPKHDGIKARVAFQVPEYHAIRQKLDGQDYMLIQWKNLEKKTKSNVAWEYELYNVTKDPYELINLLADEKTKGSIGPTYEQMIAQLEKLKKCSGTDCH